MENPSVPASEVLERNRLQLEDAERYRDFAEQVLGHCPSRTELFCWYVEMGFAKIFEVEWREGKTPTNLWYTGEEVQHPPSDTEGWQHFRCYLGQLAS